MTFTAVLTAVKRICIMVAALCVSLVAAQTAGQIHLSATVFNAISLIGIVAGLLSRSLLEPAPSPGPFPLRAPGAPGDAGTPGPGDRLALLLFVGVASLLVVPSCATPQAAQAGRAELACGTAIAPDVFAAVVTALATGGAADAAAWIAPMSELAARDGAALIKCTVAALLTPPPAAAPEMGATAVPRLSALTAQRAVMWLATR